MNSKSIEVINRLNNQILIKGELYDMIKTNESIWTIEDQNVLVLTLEKH